MYRPSASVVAFRLFVVFDSGDETMIFARRNGCPVSAATIRPRIVAPVASARALEAASTLTAPTATVVMSIRDDMRPSSATNQFQRLGDARGIAERHRLCGWPNGVQEIRFPPGALFDIIDCGNQILAGWQAANLVASVLIGTHSTDVSRIFEQLVTQ